MPTTFLEFMFGVFIGIVGVPLIIVIAMISYVFIIEPIYDKLSPARRRTKRAQKFLDAYGHDYYWRATGQMLLHLPTRRRSNR